MVTHFEKGVVGEKRKKRKRKKNFEALRDFFKLIMSYSGRNLPLNGCLKAAVQHVIIKSYLIIYTSKYQELR